jgi:hypothetical protein
VKAGSGAPSELPRDHASGGYDAFDTARMKHLELIQDVVSRLGNDGFLIKGWCLTLAAALFGFSFQTRNGWLAMLALFTTLVFWELDAYFLRCERLFRLLYAKVSERDPSVPPFFMAATSDDFVQRAEKDVKRWRVVSRPALWQFYAAMAAVAVVIALIVSLGGQQDSNATHTTSADASSRPTPAVSGPASRTPTPTISATAPMSPGTPSVP